jgi:hypothetical protein
MKFVLKDFLPELKSGADRKFYEGGRMTRQ